tara:strand:+ start:1120 stop:1266 length:147 start_codon:yes stop_codon:yes gene_type:complete
MNWSNLVNSNIARNIATKEQKNITTIRGGINSGLLGASSVIKDFSIIF